MWILRQLSIWLATAALIVAGCAPRTPDKIFEDLVEAAQKGDIDKALSYLAENSRNELSAFLITPEMKRHARDRMIEESHNILYNIQGVSIDGTNAILKLHINDPEGFGEYPNALPFILENDEWKLDLSDFL